MILSLNEIDALSRNAARGAGLSWGLAEEAGKATRWLQEKGFPGASLSASTLLGIRDKSYSDLAPQFSKNNWKARSQQCPIITGATLCDHSDIISKGDAICLTDVAFPTFLIPFAVRISENLRQTICLHWSEIRVYCTTSGIFLSGETDDLLAPQAQCVVVARCGAPETCRRHVPCEQPVDEADLHQLTALAHKTYVPSNEQSRSMGAGAGLSDND